jgi:hypothetical protein
MKYSWIVKLNKNHVVVLDASSMGGRETIVVDGQIIIDKAEPSIYHIHKFILEGKPCEIKAFGLNAYMVFSINLFVDGKKIDKYKLIEPLPDDIDPKLFNVTPPQSFKPTPSWYWLFILVNFSLIFLVQQSSRILVLPSIIVIISIVKICRANPNPLSIKHRLWWCAGLTSSNLIVFTIIKILYL